MVAIPLIGQVCYMLVSFCLCLVIDSVNFATHVLLYALSLGAFAYCLSGISHKTVLVAIWGTFIVSDVDPNPWLVDMDPHSLTPPYHEAAPTSVELYDSTASEAGNKQYPLLVQGRLKCRYVFWETELEASEFVLGIVRSGYRLPFIRFPPSVCMRNNRSALEESLFVATAIEELILANCIAECVECPLVCSPLQVVSNAKGKRRLVIDLRYINQYLHQCKFKYEGLNVLPPLFQQGDFMITFDLKSGYHHVDIHKDFSPYLGFSWRDSRGRRKFYVFRVLPFGLSTACYVFTKLLRPLVKRWRSRGIKAIVYIDDGICAAPSAQKVAQHSTEIQADLESAGFVLNVTKSRLAPHQVGEWLGFTVDLSLACFIVPDDKITRLKNSLLSIMQSYRVSVCAVPVL